MRQYTVKNVCVKLTPNRHRRDVTAGPHLKCVRVTPATRCEKPHRELCQISTHSGVSIDHTENGVNLLTHLCVKIIPYFYVHSKMYTPRARLELGTLRLLTPRFRPLDHLDMILNADK